MEATSNPSSGSLSGCRFEKSEFVRLGLVCISNADCTLFIQSWQHFSLISSIEDGSKRFKTESATMYSGLKTAAMKARQDGQLTEREAQIYIRSGNYAAVHCLRIPHIV